MTIDNESSTLDYNSTADFGSAGVSESAFGQDAGAGGKTGGDSIGAKATSLRDKAAQKLRGLADDGKGQVTATLDGLITVVREISDKLQDGSFGPVGGYAKDAADTLQGWTDGIKNRSVEDLIDDGRELVRKTPAVAVGVAVAAGFVLSRVLKAGGGRYSA